VDYSNKFNKIVTDPIEELFERAKLEFLGPEYAKAFVFQYRDYDPSTTIQSAYVKSALVHSPTGKFDNKMISKVADVAEGYIDKLKETTMADVLSVTTGTLSDISLHSKLSGMSTSDYAKTKNGIEMIKDMFDKLSEIREKTVESLSRIVDHETVTAQSFGATDGILEAAKAIGIKDPIIFKIGIIDERRCNACKLLWAQPDELTPKVYKLSELAATPGDYKTGYVASVAPTHPGCREIQTALMPGYGFSGGKIAYIGRNDQGVLWNEWSFQRTGNGWA
jgi:hypothetical protein